MVVPGHADRVGTDHGMMPVALDAEVFPVRSCLQRPIDRIKKIVAMRLKMESDHIGAQQPVDQFCLPGWAAKSTVSQTCVRMKAAGFKEESCQATLLCVHATAGSLMYAAGSTWRFLR